MAVAPLLSLLLVLPQVAQEPKSTTPEQRAADDVAAACQALAAQAIAFTGSCRFTTRNGSMADDAEAIPFRGAFDRGLALLHILDFTVLAHGAQQVQRTGEGAWTRPQGDAPDLPFSPRVLARHVATATMRSPQPVFVDGRPAVRVHAGWTGDAAAALLRETCHPNGKTQQILEHMPDLVRRDDGRRGCVDATICFDPATRSLRSVVLRVALLQDEELRPGEEADPAPEGMPALSRRALLEFTFAVTLVPREQVPMPTVDDSLRERLHWPPPPPPTPVEPQRQVKRSTGPPATRGTNPPMIACAGAPASRNRRWAAPATAAGTASNSPPDVSASNTRSASDGSTPASNRTFGP